MAAHGKAKITGTASAIELRTLGQAYYTNALGNLYDYGQSVKHVSTPDEDGKYTWGDFRTSSPNGEWSPEHTVRLIPDADGNMHVNWSFLKSWDPISNLRQWFPAENEAMAHTHPSNPGLEEYNGDTNQFEAVKGSSNEEGGAVSTRDTQQYTGVMGQNNAKFNVAVSRDYFRFYKGSKHNAINVKKDFLYAQ